MDDTEYYTYGDIRLGRGNFDLPPLLIGTMFYQDQTIVDRKNPEIFDIQKAKKRIESQISLSKKYKVPNLVEISEFIDCITGIYASYNSLFNHINEAYEPLRE